MRMHKIDNHPVGADLSVVSGRFLHPVVRALYGESSLESNEKSPVFQVLNSRNTCRCNILCRHRPRPGSTPLSVRSVTILTVPRAEGSRGKLSALFRLGLKSRAPGCADNQAPHGTSNDQCCSWSPSLSGLGFTYRIAARA